MTDRNADIPPDALKNAATVIDALEESFRPLLARLRPEIEPAIILSESAVLGE